MAYKMAYEVGLVVCKKQNGSISASKILQTVQWEDNAFFGL